MPEEKVSMPFGETVADIRNSYVQTAADAGPRQPINCADPNHKSGSVFHVDGGLCPLAGYDPPAVNAPNIHDRLVMGWLVSNAKTPDEVKWASYPIGMVQRWIERAQEAEAKIGCVAPVPQEAAPKPVRIEHTTALDFEGEIEYIKEMDRAAAPAPDSAMRGAREVIKYVESTSDNGAIMDEQVAKVIRQARSERERGLERVLRILLNEALLNWHCKPEDNCHECSAIQPTLAEASRLLGGE